MKRVNLLTVGLVSACLCGCSSLRPRETGLQDGKLRPCPPAPKCVSSYYRSGIHHIEPLTYNTSRDKAYATLVEVLNGMERSSIITRREDYLHVQFELRPIKWIDNAEFLFEEDEKVIHYCSSPAAPVGFWDWGENKRRARKIRRLFNAALANKPPLP